MPEPTDTRSPAQRRARRAWIAPAGVAAIAVATFALYQVGPPAVAEAVFIPYVASLVAGPAIVYPWVRVHGAGSGASSAAALAVPLLWLVKECRRVGLVFGFGPAVYYAFNPMSLGLFTVAALEMALAELAVRRIRWGRFGPGRGPLWVLAAVALWAGTIGGLSAATDPSELFYAYAALYGILFVP